MNEIKVHWELISCDNVMQLLEIYNSEDEIYLVMEHMKSGDLNKLIAKDTVFTEEQVKFIME